MNRENLDRNLSSLFGSSLHWLFAELHSQKKPAYSNCKEGQLQYARPFIHILESRRETENCLSFFSFQLKEELAETWRNLTQVVLQSLEAQMLLQILRQECPYKLPTEREAVTSREQGSLAKEPKYHALKVHNKPPPSVNYTKQKTHLK